MAIVLLLINLLGLIFLFFSKKEIRLSIIKGTLFFSLLVLGVTETLSLVSSLNYLSLLLSWGIINIVLIYLISKKESLGIYPILISKLKEVIKGLNYFEKFLIAFSVFILLGIFIQGLVYPTNNWDSMAYHMPRIVHWIQNESLTHYRTPIYPQLNSPPFAEIVILNINLLVGNDYLSNTVQLFYLLITSVTITLLAKELGLNKFGQILSAFILICIPEVILLGSSTHTELVLSFFMVSSIYFLLITIKHQTLISFLLLGCSLGLAATTKSTAYISLTPFLLVWMIYQLYQIISHKVQLKWLSYLVMLLSFVAINLGHYSRNYELTSSVFGADEDIYNIYVNEEHSIKMLISNVSKNLSNQFGIPKVAPIAYRATEYIHEKIRIDLNNPKITSHYTIDPLATHENNGANTYHIVLIFLSCIWLLANIKKQNKFLIVYWLAIIMSFLLFCYYLKWQPWVKLHVPFFIFYTVVLAHFIVVISKVRALFFIIISGFVVHATLILLFNWSRPLITFPPFTSEIKITDTRYEKYFSRFLRYHHDYKVVKDEIATQRFKNIGLLFGNYDMEYQLFLEIYREDIKSIHLNTCSLSESITVEGEIDCIVSTKNEDLIDYKGEKFYNVTKENDGYLYLFLKK